MLALRARIMTERSSLTGKVAVITGGSRGIGLALAHALAVEGCQVVITGRDAGSLQAAVENGGQAGMVAMACDVSNADAVQELFDNIHKRYSTVDVLVNNAGIAHALEPIEKLSLATWKQVMDTNLTGMFLCCRAALPLMRAGGTIVNNLSVSARQPFAGMAAYNASKAGALGFTNVLRLEQRKNGIRVLALILGATDTAIWEQFWPEAPREKMVSPKTVAEAVVNVLKLPSEATIEEIRMGPSAGVL
jgi:NAD(P)-dependent dehydrogenase (short-subunit alcohol dehydrogenase family)